MPSNVTCPHCGYDADIDHYDENQDMETFIEEVEDFDSCGFHFDCTDCGKAFKLVLDVEKETHMHVKTEIPLTAADKKYMEWSEGRASPQTTPHR